MTSTPRLAGRWMRVRYGDSWLARQWRRRSAVSSELTDLVCQKFVDFYLEQCKQEIVRDRRLVVRVIIDRGERGNGGTWGPQVGGPGHY